MSDNAPYTGGYSPGATRFAVDGDWTIAQPDGPPSEFDFPFEGDTIFSAADTISKVSNTPTFDDPLPFKFERTPLGTYPNQQPWNPNQSTLVFTQDFLVAAENYLPTPLNTPYDPTWANTWPAAMTNGRALRDISLCVLCRESRPRDIGGGNLRVTRTYAHLPLTRNVLEDFVYIFPAYAGVIGGGSGTPVTRPPQQRIVMSRIQIDYFIFDDLNILDWTLFNNNSGRRLNADTGVYPPGIIIPQQLFYSGDDSTGNSIITAVFDGDGITKHSSVPSMTQYLDWVNGGESTGPAEICAQSSSFGPRPWLGNIWERRTRYVLAQ